MNIANITSQIRQLSRELTEAEHNGDEEEVERLETELEELREELDALELDEIDERRMGRNPR